MSQRTLGARATQENCPTMGTLAGLWRMWREAQRGENKGRRAGSKVPGQWENPVLAWGNGGCSINICENLKEEVFRNQKVIKIFREITWNNVVCFWVIWTKLKLANYIRSTGGENRIQGRQTIKNRPEETWKIMCTCEEASVISLISIKACIFKKLRRNKIEKGVTKVPDKRV